MPAVDLTSAQLQALKEAMTTQKLELDQQAAEFESRARAVLNYPCLPDTWIAASHDVGRVAVITALHAAATRAVAAATAMHDAAASIVTSWTP